MYAKDGDAARLDVNDEARRVLAGLIVFPGWLEADPESGRHCEPQRGAVQHKRRLRNHYV
jgi:hypothetical protein